MAGKNDLANHLADKLGLSKSAAGEAVDAVIEGISNHMANGERVQIPGFGTFLTSERAARTGRNPATGETLEIAARTVARFKPGKALKDAVNS